MSLSRSFRKVRHGIEDSFDYATHESHVVLRNVGLVSAGITVLAVGVVVGRELRSRYKFSRRTPYDMYSHAGEHGQEVEYGVGT